MENRESDLLISGKLESQIDRSLRYLLWSNFVQYMIMGSLKHVLTLHFDDVDVSNTAEGLSFLAGNFFSLFGGTWSSYFYEKNNMKLVLVSNGFFLALIALGFFSLYERQSVVYISPFVNVFVAVPSILIQALTSHRHSLDPDFPLARWLALVRVTSILSFFLSPALLLLYDIDSTYPLYVFFLCFASELILPHYFADKVPGLGSIWEQSGIKITSEKTILAAMFFNSMLVRPFVIYIVPFLYDAYDIPLWCTVLAVQLCVCTYIAGSLAFIKIKGRVYTWTLFLGSSFMMGTVSAILLISKYAVILTLVQSFFMALSSIGLLFLLGAEHTGANKTYVQLIYFLVDTTGGGIGFLVYAVATEFYGDFGFCYAAILLSILEAIAVMAFIPYRKLVKDAAAQIALTETPTVSKRKVVHQNENTAQ